MCCYPSSSSRLGYYAESESLEWLAAIIPSIREWMPLLAGSTCRQTIPAGGGRPESPESASMDDLAESAQAEQVDDIAEEDIEEDAEELGHVVEPPSVEAPAAVAEEDAAPVEEKSWYVLKVQSNREDSIRDAIQKRVKIARLEEFVGEIVVPTEKVTEIKDGKKRVMERKFFPGYIMIHLVLNDDTWFVVRETPGVGDFVGAGGKPVPMTEQDVSKMLGRQEASVTEPPRLKITFQKGDRVKIREGTFENFEGDVDEVIEAKGLVRVMIQIFGRPTPVELEYWQVESM